MRQLVFSLLAAALLWAFMFSPATAGMANFWVMMTASALLLSLLATLSSPRWLRTTGWRLQDFLSGAAMAAVLWLVFWTGDKLSSMLFDFARPQVDAIYSIKDGVPPHLLSLLLILIIGPAEEIYWRGYVQRTLSQRLGANRGFILATLCYALVHAASCNFMLVMAALVAGIVWGGLYRLMPQRLSMLIACHALWDAAVFLWFPI